MDAGNRAEDNLILLPHPRPRGLSGELALMLDSRVCRNHPGAKKALVDHLRPRDWERLQ